MRLLGIPIEDPSYLFCDNESVVKSTSRPESRLTKKHQLLCWHVIREAQAKGWLKVGHEPGNTNTADLFTKQVSNDLRRKYLRQIHTKGSSGTEEEYPEDPEDGGH